MGNPAGGDGGGPDMSKYNGYIGTGRVTTSCGECGTEAIVSNIGSPQKWLFPCSCGPIKEKKGGTKYDDKKEPMALIPYSVMRDVAGVLGFGAKKYNADNWRQGIAFRRLISAAERHIGAYKDGEDLDPESGLNHISHAICCLIFLRWMAQNKPELDDRVK